MYRLSNDVLMQLSHYLMISEWESSRFSLLHDFLDVWVWIYSHAKSMWRNNVLLNFFFLLPSVNKRTQMLHSKLFAAVNDFVKMEEETLF